MTIRFRVDALVVHTKNGDVEYEFPSPLTVLAGSVGVGKTTLFELVKHGLGGDALLADVVSTSVQAVTVNVSINRDKYSLFRSTEPREWSRVGVHDLEAGRQLADHFTDKGEPTLNSLLLGSMGVPTDMHAAARSTSSTRKGARITFADLFRFMYVSQADINTDIAGSSDSYYDPKRKSVFEFLFGLTNPDILKTRSEIAKTRGDYDVARNNADVVLQFLTDSRTNARLVAQAEQLAAQEQALAAERNLDALREATSPAIDRETQTLRDLLGESERSLAEAREAVISLKQQRIDYLQETALIAQDIERLNRMQSAGDRLADIEFSVCPRCLQSIRERDSPDHACRLCLQSDPTSVTSHHNSEGSYELKHLAEQLDEARLQVGEIEVELNEANQAVDNKWELIASLTETIEKRTRNRITPQLQAFADATAALAEARSRGKELESTLRQWDRADDLGREAEELSVKLKSLNEHLATSQKEVSEHRREVLSELDAEFANTVSVIGVPGVSSAVIHPDNYLPVLNGKSFLKFSPPGGVRTATQVAYWVSLLTVALRRRDTHYPAFLLIDSPRTSLNNDDELASALYRRLVAMADASQDEIQLLIGDNELPAEYRRDYAQLNFDYDHPTIRTVRHPGREAVKTLSDVAGQPE